VTEPRIRVSVRETPDGWVADVMVSGDRKTAHRVTISRAEHDHFGGGDVAALVLRSFEFLLEREPNTSVLREFDLSVIERYFPDYGPQIRRR
jgi:hypothetical protein